MTMTGHELFAMIRAGLGPEARRHRGVDAPARRDTAIAGGSYRAPGALVDGMRAGDGDAPVTGVVVAARASTAVIDEALRRGANLVISRQAFLGDSQDRAVAKPEPALAAKLSLIEANHMMVMRVQDPRLGLDGQILTAALPRAIGLDQPLDSGNPADGLLYRIPATPAIALIRKIKQAVATSTVRLIGDPNLAVSTLAFATETSRPNGLAPLVSNPAINLVVAGEVHETETAAYVMDAITMGLPKALLLVGSIAMEEPAARALAAWLAPRAGCPVHYVPSSEGLSDIA